MPLDFLNGAVQRPRRHLEEQENIMVKKRISAAIGIVLMHVMPVYSQAAPAARSETASTLKPCFSIAVVSPLNEFQLGTPLELQVTVKNISGKDIYWSYAKTNTQYKAFHMKLEKDGQEVQTTAFHRKMMGNQRPEDPQEIEDSSSIALPLSAGSSFTWKIELTKLYQINQPGVYTISVSRFDDCSKTTIRSRPVSLRIASQ